MARSHFPIAALLQTRVSFGAFVNIFNSLIDRNRTQSSIPARPTPLRRRSDDAATKAEGALRVAPIQTTKWQRTSSGAGSSRDHIDSGSSNAHMPVCAQRKANVRSPGELVVAGAASTALNGAYTPSGSSDGVPKYSKGGFTMLRCCAIGTAGATRFWCLVDGEALSATAEGGAVRSEGGIICFYFCRSDAATPPLEVQWEGGGRGQLPGPVVLSSTDACACPPATVLAPAGAHKVGDYVRANWAGRGVFFAGEVLAVRSDGGSLDILYDDGDFEARVPVEMIRPVEIELSEVFHSFSIDDVVSANVGGHGSWSPGHIVAVDKTFRVFTIMYDNRCLEKHVPPSRVRPMSQWRIKSNYVNGQRVRANWQGCGTWVLGRICAVHSANGTFDVVYDDGEVEADVLAHRLQAAELYTDPKAHASHALSADSAQFAYTLGCSKVTVNGAHGSAAVHNVRA
jgi:hypothetical protein